jgi:hypothetical protein
MLFALLYFSGQIKKKIDDIERAVLGADACIGSFVVRLFALPKINYE